jgi:hypothetical protein
VAAQLRRVARGAAGGDADQGEGDKPPARYGWTQPICEDCWFRLNPGRKPVRLKEPGAEKCVECGSDTTSGIYVRIDPAQAKHPSLTK